MNARRRLPDLTLADAGRTFVMRPGSTRRLVLPAAYPERPTTTGPLAVHAEREAGVDSAGALTRYRVEALVSGVGTITAGAATWRIEVRGQENSPEQTRDDTDADWGERGAGHTSQWWKEQRPPHW